MTKGRSYGAWVTVIIMGIICLFAFAVTLLTRIDMTGRSLEDIEDAG